MRTLPAVWPNGPFPNSLQPLLQGESMCEVLAMNISFHSVRIEIRSNCRNKNCALKERLRELTKSNGHLKPYLFSQRPDFFLASLADSLRVRHAFLHHELVGEESVTNPKESLPGRLIFSSTSLNAFSAFYHEPRMSRTSNGFTRTFIV